MTQPGCESALYRLVSRIRRSANVAGIHTVRDMALASGVSKSGVDKIYNHRSYPCFDTLLAMAQACGTTVHEWVAELEQDKESKGKRPEPKQAKPEPTKEDKPEQAKPRKRSKGKGKNRNANGKYECFECGKEHDTAKEVRACYESHKTNKQKHPKPPVPKANPIPETPEVPENSKDSSFVDVVALLKGANPNSL